MDIIASNQLEGLDRCPHCGIAKPSLVYKAHTVYPYPAQSEWRHWVMYQCTSCHDVVCALILASASGMERAAIGYLHTNKRRVIRVVPEPRLVSNELPDRPRRYIEQAISSLHAPDGATMLAGSAVDSMLKLKGYEDGSVYTRIEKAVGDGVLTTEMSEWAHAVRLEANKPRHADIDDPHATQGAAKQAIEFAESLGEYLFVLPARIERGKLAANDAAKNDETSSGS